MPRITRVYTRTGDDGTTGLIGGRRVAKDSSRVEAYGTVDELSSQLGVVRAHEPTGRIESELCRIQNELFHLGAMLSDPEDSPGPRLRPEHVAELEKVMDELSEDLDPLLNFVLPGGCRTAAHLHVARTVCRRAERDAVALARSEAVDDVALHYLNRLSDALFVFARYENWQNGRSDVLWDSHA